MVVLKVPLPDIDSGGLELQGKSSLMADWGSNKLETLGPKHSVLVSQGFCNNQWQTGWLKTTEICSLSVLVEGSLKSRCQQGRFCLETPKEKQDWASLLLLTAASSPWWSLASRHTRQSLPSPSHLLLLCDCLLLF